MIVRTAYGLLEDGTTWENVPVRPVTFLQLEKTMKANQWDSDTNPLTIAAFMSWHAAKTHGVPVPEKWADFTASALEADIKREDTDPTKVRTAIRTSGPSKAGTAQRSK